MKIFTIPEKKAAQVLQHDLPLTDRPFDAIANVCGLSTLQVISMSQRLLKNGTMRKFGAILRHQKAGYRKNALVMWSVPPDKIENTGNIFASLPFVSHCYERDPAFQGKYNLFTMLHSQDDSITSLIHNMSQFIGSNDFLILESLHEYKKTSPEYFDD